MASTQSQQPACPECRRTDEVKTLQAAYQSGIERFAPPAMPIGRVTMGKTMLVSTGLIALCAFLIIVLLAPDASDTVRIIQGVLTIIAILAVLIISFLAFNRVTRGDLESQQLLPAWDEATANWGRLRYCQRDNTVFDPQQAQYAALSDEAVASLLSVEGKPEERRQLSHA